MVLREARWTVTGVTDEVTSTLIIVNVDHAYCVSLQVNREIVL